VKKFITRTPQSEEDAYATYRHIAIDSVDAAEAYFDALFDTFDKLLEHPKMGAVVEEAKGELRGLRLIPISSNSSHCSALI
jgi:plasmid stabilization system protein ParE